MRFSLRQILLLVFLPILVLILLLLLLAFLLGGRDGPQAGGNGGPPADPPEAPQDAPAADPAPQAAAACPELDPNAATTANLYVIRSTSLRQRQLLGGTLGDPILQVQFRAEQEDIAVTGIRLVATGSLASSVERLEFSRLGAQTPFGAAAPCQGQPGAFCAALQAGQFTMKKGETTDILIRPRMRTDQAGAFSGEKMQIMLTDAQAHTAATCVALVPNDGDGEAGGEIFIGTNRAAENMPNIALVGAPNVTVLSKLTPVVDRDPVTRPVPSGTAEIGTFRFAAASHANSKDGLNTARIIGLYFIASGSGVAFDAGSFAVYNAADEDPEKMSPCAEQEVGSGFFSIDCSSIDPIVDLTADPGEHLDVALKAGVRPVKGAASSLRVSLDSFASPDRDGPFGLRGSHLRWVDEDRAAATPFDWMEFGDTVLSAEFRTPAQ